MCGCVCVGVGVGVGVGEGVLMTAKIFEKNIYKRGIKDKQRFSKLAMRTERERQTERETKTEKEI